MHLNLVDWFFVESSSLVMKEYHLRCVVDFKNDRELEQLTRAHYKEVFIAIKFIRNSSPLSANACKIYSYVYCTPVPHY